LSNLQLNLNFEEQFNQYFLHYYIKKKKIIKVQVKKF